MKRALVLLFAALALALLVNAQFGGLVNRAKNAVKKAEPVVTRAEKAVANYTDWTPAEEQEIGEETAAKMITMFGLLDAPELTRYVNLVGQSVAQFAPRQVPYRFAILDSGIVGAFSLPGGYIFITRTALEGMHDEAELAGVLGHEILHVSARHLELEIRGRKNSAWAIEEARVKTVGDREFIRQRADVFVKEMFDLGVSREKEEAADQQGTLMAVQAGYVADGLLQFLRTMQAAQTRSPNALRQWSSTHPAFADRIAYLTPIVDRAGRGGQTLEERFTAAVH